MIRNVKLKAHASMLVGVVTPKHRIHVTLAEAKKAGSSPHVVSPLSEPEAMF